MFGSGMQFVPGKPDLMKTTKVEGVESDEKMKGGDKDKVILSSVTDIPDMQDKAEVDSLMKKIRGYTNYSNNNNNNNKVDNSKDNSSSNSEMKKKFFWDAAKVGFMVDKAFSTSPPPQPQHDSNKKQKTGGDTKHPTPCQ